MKSLASTSAKPFRKRALVRLLVPVAALLAWTGAATAVPITYTLIGSGSGSLDNTAFNDEVVTVTLTGDTSAAFITTPGQTDSDDPGGLYINSGSTTVSVHGITDTIAVPTYAFLVPFAAEFEAGQLFSARLAILGVEGIGLMWINGDIIKNYDLVSSFGPVSGDGSASPLPPEGEALHPTSRGFFYWLTPPTNVTFTATTAAVAVPEPSGLVLLSVGLVALLGRGLRRRSGVADFRGVVR